MGRATYCNLTAMALLASLAPLARRAACNLPPPELGRYIALDLADAAAKACKDGVPAEPVFVVRHINERPMAPHETAEVALSVRRHLPLAMSRHHDGSMRLVPSFARASYELFGPFRGFLIMQLTGRK
jgi:hypothetical protein